MGGVILGLFLRYNKIHNINDYGCISEYNTRAKYFNNGTIKLLKYSFPCFKGKILNNKHNGSFSQDQLDRKTKKYLKVVRTNIIDLALNYDKWEYFITLTFDTKHLNRKVRGAKIVVNYGYSHNLAIDCLRRWLDNQKKRNPDFVYLLVPEFHQSGRLHFHGLVSNVPTWEFKESRYPLDYKIISKRNELIIINGKQIYNLINYKLGFTTISYVESCEKVSNYISKYATKDLITLKNKKRYWFSRNLEKPKTDFFIIDSNLKEYLEGSCVDYYNEFKKEDCSIEVAQLSGNKLPIIDIMLPFVYSS